MKRGMSFTRLSTSMGSGVGKSSRPLTLFVTDPEMLAWPEVQEKVAQGHKVGTWVDIQQASLQPDEIDVIMGSTCWRMDTRLRRYFKNVLDAARRVRYPKA